MAVPKGYRTNIDITNHKIGPEKRQEWLDGIADKGTFLPKGVLEEDMDQTFIEFMNNDKRISLTIDGKKVPVIFLTIQRWTEFTKTWEFTDEYKNIKLPFITIVRKPDIQQGQNQAGLWNIPGNRTYVYYKVPTWDGARKGIDLYKVPQPTAVDMTYEVRLFTNRMKDLNKFNRKVQRAFQSRQCYITPNGHPMPLILESIGDESNIDDFENRRFYVSLFEMKLLGYLLDEEDFEVVPTINRAITSFEVEDTLKSGSLKIVPHKDTNKVTYNFVWRPNSDLSFSFTSQYQLSFSQLIDVKNITRITISINSQIVFDGTVLNTPLVFHANDIVTVRVYKTLTTTGSFSLIGNTY